MQMQWKWESDTNFKARQTPWSFNMLRGGWHIYIILYHFISKKHQKTRHHKKTINNPKLNPTRILAIKWSSYMSRTLIRSEKPNAQHIPYGMKVFVSALRQFATNRPMANRILKPLNCHCSGSNHQSGPSEVGWVLGHDSRWSVSRPVTVVTGAGPPRMAHGWASSIWASDLHPSIPCWRRNRSAVSAAWCRRPGWGLVPGGDTVPWDCGNGRAMAMTYDLFPKLVAKLIDVPDWASCAFGTQIAVSQNDSLASFL